MNLAERQKKAKEIENVTSMFFGELGMELRIYPEELQLWQSNEYCCLLTDDEAIGLRDALIELFPLDTSEPKG